MQKRAKILMKSSKNGGQEYFILGGRGLHFGAFFGGPGPPGGLPGASWRPPGGLPDPEPILGHIFEFPGPLPGASWAPPGGLPGASRALKTAQDGAKMAPRWPKMAPRRPPGGALGPPGRQKEAFQLACRKIFHFQRILLPKNIQKSSTCLSELLGKI